VNFKNLLLSAAAVGALVGVLNPCSLAAETRYISDTLYVPLRSGAGNQYRIINAAVRSGTVLTLLEENDDASWARVRLEGDVEGWVPTQYIVAEPTAQLRLTEALAKMAKLEQNNAQLSQKNQQLIEENNQLQGLATNQSTERDTMAKELQSIKQISRDALSLKDSNTELLEKNQLLQTERDTLIAENEILKSDQRTDFLLYGAGLILLGVFLALAIPALAPKKGHSEWK
jgi:SH3 domain protein